MLSFLQLIFIISLFLLSIAFVLANLFPKSTPSKRENLSALIVLGSGGHTAEILTLVKCLNKKRYFPRFYISASSDLLSLTRAKSVESTFESEGCLDEKKHYFKLYRSREVGQSYITSIFTTIVSFLHSFYLLLKINPDIVICNGPGTCLPLCVLAFIFKAFRIKNIQVVYIESVARVKKLSLTGMLLYRFNFYDHFLVQWPYLVTKHQKAVYVGRLM